MARAVASHQQVVSALRSIDQHFESETQREVAFVVSNLIGTGFRTHLWRGSLRECVLGVGSQISGHAVCIVITLTNAVPGGITAATGHDMILSLLVGTAIYAAAVVARYLCSHSCHLPSFKTAVLSVGLG